MKKLALLLLVTAASYAAPPTYDLRFRFFPETGKSMRYRSHETFHAEGTVVGANGKRVTQPLLDEQEEKEYIEKAIAVAGDEQSEYTRVYSKPADKSYAGQTVRFVRKSGKVEVIGKEISPKDLKSLEESANNSDVAINRAMMPKQRVAVGGTWQADAAPLARTIGFAGVDMSQSKAVAKLVSVSEKDGHKTAAVDVDLDLALISGPGSPIPGPARLRGTIRYEGAIDGSTRLRVVIDAGFSSTVKGTKSSGEDITATYDFKYTADEQQEDAPEASAPDARR